MNALKQLLMVNLFAKIIKYLKPRDNSAQTIFRQVYLNNSWRDGESASGPGSNTKETHEIRIRLPELFKELNIKSLLDIPCGDFNWMKQIDLNGINYLGADIIPELVEKNKQYAGKNITFQHLNIIENPLPKVDLILVRDCLVHFPDDIVLVSLKNIISSGSKYLLITTFTTQTKNEVLNDWGWRALNLQIAPYNFPEPIKIINEKYPSSEHRDKSLGLWRIDELMKSISF